MTKDRTTVAPTFVPGAQKRRLSDRIEAAYDRAIEQRRLLEYAQWEMSGQEEAARLELAVEWASARDDQARADLLVHWLAGEKMYQQARDDRDSAALELCLALGEVERLRLLVEAKKAEGGA